MLTFLRIIARLGLFYVGLGHSYHRYSLLIPDIYDEKTRINRPLPAECPKRAEITPVSLLAENNHRFEQKVLFPTGFTGVSVPFRTVISVISAHFCSFLLLSAPPLLLVLPGFLTFPHILTVSHLSDSFSPFGHLSHQSLGKQG